MAILPGLLNRLTERVAEQELADYLEMHRRTYARVGLPYTAEDRAKGEACWRWSRTLPANLDIEEAIQRLAAWWADQLGLSADEIIAEAERLVAEHDAAGECAEDCPVCEGANRQQP